MDNQPKDPALDDKRDGVNGEGAVPAGKPEAADEARPTEPAQTDEPADTPADQPENEDDRADEREEDRRAD